MAAKFVMILLVLVALDFTLHRAEAVKYKDGEKVKYKSLVKMQTIFCLLV